MFRLTLNLKSSSYSLLSYRYAVPHTADRIFSILIGLQLPLKEIRERYMKDM